MWLAFCWCQVVEARVSERGRCWRNSQKISFIQAVEAVRIAEICRVPTSTGVG